MPTRFAPEVLRRLSLVAVLIAAFSGPADTDPSTQTLTVEQGLDLAVSSLRSGQPQVTLKLTDGLLQAYPQEPLLYYLRASAHASLGHLREGRRAGARAYRLSETSEAKFQAAQLTARLALAEKRPTLAQVWLRRTAIHAPDEKAKKLIAADYKVLRRINPFSFRLRTELKPSTNINNGADTALQIIDGVPVTGRLSGSAQALSGIIGSVDLSTRYRLHETDRTLTTAGARIYVQRVNLSSEAKRLAPGVENSDFASTFVEASLRHAFSVGDPAKGGAAGLGLAVGAYYYAGDRNYSFARVNGDRTWRLARGTKLTVSGLAEKRFDTRYSTSDAETLGLGLNIYRPLRNGDGISFSLALRDTEAEHSNGTYQSASLRLAYAFGKPVGPIRINAGLVFGYSDYPNFRSAGFIQVPGGRQDESVYGDINLFFDRYDYAGFAPMLRLRAGRKSSNDSRFDISEYSVSLGIESKF